MDRKNKIIISLLLTTFLMACKADIKTSINVMPNKSGNRLKVKIEDGEKIELPAGEIKVQFKITEKKRNKSYLKFFLKKGNKKYHPKAVLNLPKASIFLSSNEPIRITPNELGQPFGLIITREIDSKKDLFFINFTDNSMETSLARSQFSYKAKKVKYNNETESFLETYQKVKRKKRGLVFKINGEVDWMVTLGKDNWGGKTLDHIVNYGAMALISPWVYSRYSNIKWLIGDVSEEQTKQKWKDVIDNNPVIDYISWVHDGDQHDHFLNYKNKREHQLRMVYSGACNSEGSSEFIRDFGAAGTVGHFETSASPLWQFNVVKKWAYGFSLKSSVKKAWKSGVRKIKALEFITFAKYWQEKSGVLDWKDTDDLISQSELMLSHTDEIPSSKIYIDLSTVVSEKKIDEQITTKKVTEIIKKDNSKISID